MRTTTSILLATASTLALTAALAAPAAAAPSAATTTPPLVYVTAAQDGVTSTIDSVRYDATGRRLIASSSTSNVVIGPAARFSPDHSRVAWPRTDYATTPPSASVQVMTLSTRAVASFPLPAGAAFGTGSYLTWTPDSARLVVTLTDGTTSTISSLDLASGAVAPIYAIPGGASVSSLAVSADGSIGFTTSTGVAVLPGGRTPVRALYTSGSGESCTVVRARPAAQREFTYRCDSFDTASRQVLRSVSVGGTQRVVYTGSTSGQPATFLESFAWAPSGAQLAFLTTSVRTVDEPTCTNAMTTSVSTVNARGGGRAVVRTEPTITAQTCRGSGYGDVQDVVWSPDGTTIVFLHATKFLGPQFAYAVAPATPGTQTVLARQVVDLSS